MPLLQVQLICSVGYALIVGTAVMNLISSPLSSQDTFFCGFPALEEMTCEFHVLCAFLCTAVLELAHQELILALFVARVRHNAAVCSSGNISCGKGQQTGGNPGEVRGWHMWHFRTGSGNWACLGCSGDLIAVYIRVITEETEPDWPWGCPGKGQEPAVVAFCKGNCGLIAGRKGFSGSEGPLCFRHWKQGLEGADLTLE